MKNSPLFLIVLLLTCYLTANAQNICNVKIVGSNYDGTSWYGAYIEVWQDTLLRGTFTLAEHESERTEEFTIYSDDSVRFVWHSGINENNCQFSIYHADGIPIITNSNLQYYDGQTIITANGHCPTCPHPINLMAVNHLNALELSWTPVGNEMTWRVYVGDSVYTTTVPSLTVSGLTNGTLYDVSVLALCGDGDSSTALNRIFSTLAVLPVDTMPWTCGFTTGTERACWHIFNGDMGPIHEHYQDQWVINPLPDDTTDHNWALYITDDITTKPNHHQTPWQSTPYAYAVFDLERGEYQCSFDWRANGGHTQPNGGFSINNYLRVFMLPDSIINIDYVTLNNIPTGGIPLDDGYGLTGVTEWQTHDGHFSIKESGRYKMVFFWRNFSEEAQPPAAVDNISINRVPCATPADIRCTDSTAESLTVTWMPLGNETEWYIDWGTGYDIAYDTVYTIQWLNARTSYNVCVQALCDNGDTSLAACSTFTTLPVNPTEILPLYCDFEDSTISSYWLFDNGTQRNKWCIGEAVNNTSGGSHAMYVSADSGATNAYVSDETNIFTYLFLNLDTGTYEYSYDWKCNGTSGSGNHNRGYMLAAVVPANTPISAGMQGSWFMTWNLHVSHPQGAIPIDGNQALNEVTEWQNRSSVFHIDEPGLYKMVFFWHNIDGSTFQPPAAVDNIYVNQATCLPPTDLSVTSDSNSITLTWHPTSGENTWLVKTGDFTQTVSDTFYTFQNLNPGRLYSLGVCAICNDDFNSMWSYIDSYTDCGTIVSMPWIEDFNDAHWFQCWDTLNNGTHLSGWRTSSSSGMLHNSGIAINFCVSYQPEDDWLITPPIRLDNSSGHNLRWQCSGNPYDHEHNDHITVLISNSDNLDPSAFTDTLFSDYITNVWTDYMADLSTHNGQTVRIAFIHDGYAAWQEVDNVIVEERPSCPPPTGLAVLRNDHSTELSWNPGGSESLWEVNCGDQTAVVNTTNYTFYSLQPGKAYTFAVRAICGSGDTSEYAYLTRTTLYHPAVETLPYFCDFSDTEAYNWTIVADTNRNCWYVGSAAYFGASDSLSLYVSFDQGATNRYTLYNQATYIYAYRTFNLSAGDYNCSFFWRANGISHAEMSVYLLPSDVELHDGEFFAYNFQPPLGTITMGTQLIGQLDWDLFYTEFTIPAYGQYNLTFVWHCGAIYGSIDLSQDQPAAAIDNISLRPNSCPEIQHLTAVDIGTQSIEIDWNDQGATQWEIEYGPVGHMWGTGNRMLVDSHPWTLTGLDILSTYDIWVRPICGEGDTGIQKLITVGTSFCNNTAHAAIGNFGNDGTVRTSILAPVSNCILTEIIVDADELYPGMTISGIQLLYDSDIPIEGDTAVDIYLQPTNKSMFLGDLDIVPCDTALSVHVFHGSFDDFSRGWNSVVFNTEYTYNGTQNLMVIVRSKSIAPVPSAKFRSFEESDYKSLQLRGSNDIDPYYPYTYNRRNTYKQRPLINFISCLSANCPKPEGLHVTQSGYDNVTVAWNGDALHYRVSVRAADSSVWRDEVVVNNTSYTITGLHSARTYQYRVLSDCGNGVFSPWATIYINTDTLPCAAPSNLHVTATDLHSVTVDWSDNDDWAQWCVHVWNTTFDSLYYTDHHPYIVNGLASEVQYSCAVMTICGVGIAESDETSELTFTTASCPRVTGVSVMNVTSSTALITWNHCADIYQLEYGIGDFEQGTGTLAVIMGQGLLYITGLQTNKNYTVYVRAMCDAQTYGRWSTKVQFYTSASVIEDVETTESDIRLVPNPASDMVTILSPTSIECVKVYDLHGILWSDVKPTQNGQTNSVHLSVANYPKGIYIVMVHTEYGILTRKLVVK